MKELMIMRHAKTEAESKTGKDIDRKLDEKGRLQAQNQGKYLKSIKYKPNLILCSTANRTKETLSIMMDHAGWYKVDIQMMPALYMATEDELLEILDLIENDVSKVMIIGHNFGVHQLVQSFYDEYLPQFKTATIASFSFKTFSWLSININNAKLNFLKTAE